MTPPPVAAYEAPPEGSDLRNYDGIEGRVKNHYEHMNANQTVEYVDSMLARFCKKKKTDSNDDEDSFVKMSIMEAVDTFEFMDESDPDFDENNTWHLYQTAEACRLKFPDKPWMHLVGLLHDLGKSTLNKAGLPQWSIGGDIFPVGCAFEHDSLLFPEAFKNNPDTANEKYNTKLGIYQEHCGFDKVKFAFGHDQFMYSILANYPECKIPREGLYLIRFHSFYPWHDKNGYVHLASDYDKEVLPLLQDFQKTDLYSKVEDLPKLEEIRPYYAKLVEEYCPGQLYWPK